AERGSNRPVYIVPIVWKLRYVGDVSAAMHRDMDRIEAALGLPHGDRKNVTSRFWTMQENILRVQSERFGYSEDSEPELPQLDFFDRQDAFRFWLVGDLESRYAVEPSDSIERRIRRLDRAVRAERSRLRDAAVGDKDPRVVQVRDDLARAEEAFRLGGFTRDVYSTRTLSQVPIAVCLQRIRSAILTSSQTEG